MIDYGENFCKAVDILFNQKIQGLKYDKTVICTIIDLPKNNDGKYYVQEGSGTKYYAYSENSYRKNTQVYVTIPQGDYNNQKIISGKYNGEEKIYSSPINKLMPITDNLLSGTEEIGLTANGTNNSAIVASEENIVIPTDATHLVISTDFKTNLKSYESGTFGLKLILQASEKVYEFDLSSDDMFGQVMNMQTYLTQQKIFDIIDIKETNFIATVELYQNSDFLPNKVEEDPNIFVSGPSIKILVGYLGDSEDLIIYSTESLEYFSNESSPIRAIRINNLNRKIYNLTWYTKINNTDVWTELDEFKDQPSIEVKLNQNYSKQSYKVVITDDKIESNELTFTQVFEDRDNLEIKLLLADGTNTKGVLNKGSNSYKWQIKLISYNGEIKNLNEKAAITIKPLAGCATGLLENAAWAYHTTYFESNNININLDYSHLVYKITLESNGKIYEKLYPIIVVKDATVLNKINFNHNNNIIYYDNLSQLQSYYNKNLSNSSEIKVESQQKNNKNTVLVKNNILIPPYRLINDSDYFSDSIKFYSGNNTIQAIVPVVMQFKDLKIDNTYQWTQFLKDGSLKSVYSVGNFNNNLFNGFFLGDKSNTQGLFGYKDGQKVVDISQDGISNTVIKDCTTPTGVTISSDIRLKTDIRDFDERYDKFFDELYPCNYILKKNSNVGIINGFIAQEVLKSLADNELSDELRSIVRKDKSDEEYLSLNYAEFIPLNTWQIQKLKNRVSKLEKEIQELKEKMEK